MTFPVNASGPIGVFDSGYGGLTILENIRIGRKDATDEEVIAAAKLANVDRFAEKLPDGWNANIGENGCELSGGERQRISIARAFLKDASFGREHAKKSPDCSNWVNRTAFSIGCTRYARIRKRNTPRGLSGGVARQRDFPPTRPASLSPCGAEPCPSPMPHRSQSRTGTIQSPFWETERHGPTNFSALPCPGPYRSFQGAKRPVDGKHRQRAAEFDEETVNP